MFTNPSARVGYDTRSIFKWGLTGLNLEFSLQYERLQSVNEEIKMFLSIVFN